MIDERTEQLIHRRLDVGLTDDEALELDKALLRCPEARQLLHLYEQDDALAADALKAALGEPVTQTPQLEHAVQSRRWPTRLHRFAGLTAVAAAVAFAVLVAGRFVAPRHAAVTVHPVRPPVPADNGSPAEPPSPEAPRPETLDTALADAPPRTQQPLTRELLGVFDEETGTFYFLEALPARPNQGPTLANY